MRAAIWDQLGWMKKLTEMKSAPQIAHWDQAGSSTRESGFIR